MDIHPIVFTPLAFVEPELFQGLQFFFWKITKLLTYAGILSAFVFVLVAMSKRVMRLYKPWGFHSRKEMEYEP